MPSNKLARTNDDIQLIMSKLLREIKDPRVSGAMVSITAAQVTPDMKYATVYFSVLGGDPKETKKGLDSAKGFIRREIAARLNLRNTPEFNFVFDDSIRYGAHISKLLEDIKTTDGGKESE